MSGSSPGARLALLRIASLPIETLEPLAAPETRACLVAAEALAAALDTELPRLTDALHGAAGPPVQDPAAGRRRSAVIGLRRDLHNGRRVSAAALAAARQNLPAEVCAALDDFLSRRREVDRLREDSLRRWRRDLARTRRTLLELARVPALHEGIRLVSRALWERLQVMRGSDPARWRHGERHAAAKLAAYAGRCAAKTSPNATFCATALAWIGGAETSAPGVLGMRGENRQARVEVLLSVAEARKIAACLGGDRAAWPAVVPRPNQTLRREGRAQDAPWLFWRPVSLRRLDDLEVLSRTRAQPILELFFEAAAGVTLTVASLLSTVAERSGIAVEELEPFFALLVEQGLLIAEIEPPYNAPRPLAFVTSRLRQAGCEPAGAAAAAAVDDEIAALSRLPPEERIAAYGRLETRIARLPHRRPLKSDELFRLDSASALEVTLPDRVREELEPPLRRAVRLFAALYPERAFLAPWAERFLSRHPADTEVPLLDVYHGLFEPEAQERPGLFPDALPADPGGGAAHVRVRDLLAARSRSALAAGEHEVVLTEDDWQQLLGAIPEPPWSAGVLFQIAAGSVEDIAAGRYRMVLNGLFGAGIALARFARLHDGSEDGPVSREVARSWQPLARDGAVLAEVTYTHQGRSANAGLRPSLFRHEIELLGERATPGAEVIPLRELAVRWDSAGARFVLRWLPRGVEVVPVISSGINPEGFVAFLVEIGCQGQQRLGWFPGFDVPGITQWPRCRSGRLVLFRRRWTFAPGTAPATVTEPPDERDPDAALYRFFARAVRWRRAHALPRHVFVHTSADPKPFLVDLDSPVAVDLLRRALAPLAGATPPVLHVTEMFPAPQEMWAADGRGHYATELLLHLQGPAGLP